MYDELVNRVNAIQTADTSNLLGKSDCNTRIYKIEKKIMAENIATRLNQANLGSKNDIAGFAKQTDFDEKLKKKKKK